MNAALAGLTYRGEADWSGEDEIVLGANDLGNTGSGGAGTDRRSTSMAATTLVGGAFTIYGEVDGEFQLVVVRRGYKTVQAGRLVPGTEGLELVMMPDLPQASSDGR